jgi:hypothetical protein
LVPYLEQSSLHNAMNYESAANAQPTVTQMRVAMFNCHSEINDKPKVVSSTLTHRPTSFGVDFGMWLVFDPNIPSSIQRGVWRALGTRSGGEVVSSGGF